MSRASGKGIKIFQANELSEIQQEEASLTAYQNSHLYNNANPMYRSRQTMSRRQTTGALLHELTSRSIDRPLQPAKKG